MVSLQVALVAMALSGSGQTVMLDFYADWCAPCRAMGPTIDALVEKGYPVRRVNIDRDRALAARFSVTSIPCFVMLVNGQEVDRVVEPTTFSRLERMCQMGVRAAPPAELTPPVAEPIGQPIPPQNLSPPEFPQHSQPPVSAPGGEASGAPLNPPAEAAGRLNAAAAMSPGEPSRLPSATDAGVRLEAVSTSTGSPGEPSKAEEAVSPRDLLAASVRLRVEDPNGRSCGSGTIIDNRNGLALVLTCGHLFRDSGGKGPISVDLFDASGMQTVEGKLFSYDLTRDVGLVVIRCPGRSS